MRTNIDIDLELMERAFRSSKAKTKKALIREALLEFVETRERLNLIDIKGKINFREDYDYKRMRERASDGSR